MEFVHLLELIQLSQFSSQEELMQLRLSVQREEFTQLLERSMWLQFVLEFEGTMGRGRFEMAVAAAALSWWWRICRLAASFLGALGKSLTVRRYV
jgi:hypothetical protein